MPGATAYRTVVAEADSVLIANSPVDAKALRRDSLSATRRLASPTDFGATID
ncbi:hypothetical protein GCM10019017_46030 [Streptomyces showdoensis]